MDYVYALLRFSGYIIALPGNLLWKFGYNKYYGYTGGKISIVGSVPTAKPPVQPPTAVVTPSVSAVIPATPVPA